MRTRGHFGKIHWVFILFIALAVVFAVMALAPVVSAMRQPPYVRKAVQFMELLRQNQFEEAAKLLDAQFVPKEKRDLKKALEERMPMWGSIERISLMEVVERPSDLKHPKASEGVRVDLHLQCYLSPGSAFIYLIPQNGDWVVVDYAFQ